MEVGVGIHGEPGRRREKVSPPRASSTSCWTRSSRDLKPAAGRELLLHVNGFGGTPLMELYLLYHGAARGCAPRAEAVRSLVGNYTTSLEMAGASLTVTLLDDEMRSLWDAPVRTAALRW